MKTTLYHLPQNKQDELRLIRDVLATDKQVHMVILFGSYATGKWVDDIYAEEGTTYSYHSDYDILVITPTENFSTRLRVEEAIKQRCADSGRVKTAINTIFHGIRHVNNALLYGNYFFADIKREGILLFDSGKYKLAEPKVLAPEELRCKMQENFEQWYNGAVNFYDHYVYGLSKNTLKEAAFMLHQAAERFYTAILLTYTDYRPKEHNLRELDIKAQAEDARFAEAFPKESEEQKDRFELLVRAYIDARYRMKQYHVTKDDLEYLGQRVNILKELTEKLCKERIAIV